MVELGIRVGERYICIGLFNLKPMSIVLEKTIQSERGQCIRLSVYIYEHEWYNRWIKLLKKVGLNLIIYFIFLYVKMSLKYFKIYETSIKYLSICCIVCTQWMVRVTIQQPK